MSRCLVNLVCFVYLVYFVNLVYLVDLVSNVYLVFWVYRVSGETVVREHNLRDKGHLGGKIQNKLFP
jgi:hypothetical protein